MQAIVGLKNVANGFDATFLRERPTMPRKKSSAAPMGRPRSIHITPEELDRLAESLQQSSLRLKDAAKEMRENEVPSICIPAAKAVDEHVPGCSRFSVVALAEVGPASVAFHLGRKSTAEKNQERYQKSKQRQQR